MPRIRVGLYLVCYLSLVCCSILLLWSWSTRINFPTFHFDTDVLRPQHHIQRKLQTRQISRSRRRRCRIYKCEYTLSEQSSDQICNVHLTPVRGKVSDNRCQCAITFHARLGKWCKGCVMVSSPPVPHIITIPS